MGISVPELFENIEDIIVKTCISVEPYILCGENRTFDH
jgi:hypothetical protein